MLHVGDAAPTVTLRPIFGLARSVPPAAGEGPLVLCFVRPFASPFSRAVMAAIQARYADFDRVGVQLMVVTRTDLAEARDFVPRYHVLAPVVVDVDGALHDRFGVGVDKGLVRSLAGLASPATVRTAVDALRHGHGRPHPRITQLGAQFVVGPDGRLAMVHYDRTIFERPDLDALLACASAL
ncbi:MAG: hypothetical protein D6798_19170 [Deltaproteobacteria bacterium]|nr:MAG: hypothetical protein D6798_19170 [Deltaproteobacteria bacterium]